MSADKPVKIIRKLPVELSLFEFETEDGKRHWAVVYAAEVDGRDVSGAAVGFLGAQDTAEQAIKSAAQRTGPLGF